MRFRVEREALAEAVAWTARGLPARPPVPVLAGVLLEVDGQRLTVSGYDYEVSTQTEVEIVAESGGRALVSGRLLAEITRALPHEPVEVSVRGGEVEITCDTAWFTLPTMPVEDYPALPAMPRVIGAIDADDFATAVNQTAVAAGRDDTLPMLTGIRIDVEGEQLSMVSTDRYRIAVRELNWRPDTLGATLHALVPAKTLVNSAKALASGKEVTVALGNAEDGKSALIGFAADGRRTTSRLLDVEFPMRQVRSHLDVPHVVQARLDTHTFVEVVKRVALVAERNTPVRLSFTGERLTISAGGTEAARASQSMAAEFDGEEAFSTAFNPHYLLDGLSAIGAETAVLSFTAPMKPTVLTGHNPDDAVPAAAYSYVLMPVRVAD